MMLTPELMLAIIMACIAVIGLIINYGLSARSKRTEQSKEGKEDGIILTEIGYVKSGIDDIKRKQELQDQQHVEVIARLTSVESSAKQAHKRIDKIEGRDNHD